MKSAIYKAWITQEYLEGYLLGKLAEGNELEDRGKDRQIQSTKLDDVVYEAKQLE